MAVNPGGNGSPDTPHSMPVTTPTFGGSDNWSLQALVDVKTTISSLNTTVSVLSERIKDLSAAQEKTSEKLASIEKKIYAATAIITLVIAVGGFFANKAIDFGLDMAKRQANEAPTPVSSQAIPTQLSAPTPAITPGLPAVQPTK